METNEKLSDLSLSDLCSLHSYLDDGANVIAGFISSLKRTEITDDDKEFVVKAQIDASVEHLERYTAEMEALEQEIEKRRGNLFIH